MAFKERIIGIDLGTTNSCVAVCEYGKTVVIPNIEGGRTTPSVVYLDHSGSRLIGAPAKRRAIKYPDRTIASVKRHMGSNHRVMVDNVGYSPEQISAYILEKLKTQAQEYLNEKVSKAIITVPAYFDDSQRLSTKHAGKLAGLDVLRVINEPTACALAYGLNKVAPGQETNLIIFDFGGGTFDVSILHISEGVVQVKATNGNNRLGGDDFDTRIAQYLNNYVIETYGVNPGADITSRMRLTEAAEKVKIELSGMRSTHVSMPFIAVAKGQPVHLELDLTVDDFNRITEDLVKATAAPIEGALADAKLKATDIEKVVMVGGTTRIPAVAQFIRSYFKMEPAKTINPDEAIAIGAAIQGGILNGDIEELLLLDVIPMSLGIETDGGLCTRIIERNTTIPVSRTHKFVTTKNNQTNLPVHVLQGEGQTAAGNISLARFQINDIPKAPAGQQTVEIEFHVDADGIFHCGYKHEASARDAIVLKRTSGFDKEQLEQLLAAEKEMIALRAQAQAELDAEEEAARKGGRKPASSTTLPKLPGQQARSAEHRIPESARSSTATATDTGSRSFLDTIKEWFTSLLGKK